MNRYLLNFSYIGTNYSGVAKTSAKNVTNAPKAAKLSIQEVIEDAFQRLKPKPVNSIELQLSSRTDSGVHALNSTAHIDLERLSGAPYHPMTIVTKLNKLFDRWNEPIRILNAQLVNPEFSAQRDAINRTYLYRVAVHRSQHDKSTSKRQAFYSLFIPIEEQRRCHFILNNGFEIERAREVAQMFVGVHDFRSFMNVSHEQKTKHPFFARREMSSITIRPGRTIVTPENYDKTVAEFEFWDFEFNARSYIYRQIRKTMGTILAAADGTISKRDVYEMITIPSKHSWVSSIGMAPAYGLYLVNVEYPDELVESNLNLEKLNRNVNLSEEEISVA